MRVERLQLVDFRNFQTLQLEFRPRINFFVGDNGQGKTNFLEAVYLLGHGITFRPVTQGSLIRQGQSSAKIKAKISEGEFDYSVDFLVESGRKSATINGKTVTSADLLRHFPTVLFSPESLAVIKEGPEQRRQLTDELLISHNPRHGQLLREQARSLKARNRLLRNLSENLGNRRETELSLESLNKIYFLLCTHLTSARIKALQDIQTDLSEALHLILDEPGGDISVDYLISQESAIHWTETQIFDALRKRHQTLAQQEMNAGASLVGPHKHDIKFVVNGNDSRFYCSQGQQRAVILSLKIAQIVYHHRVHQTYPVLLLDDVLSELDMKKRANLMRFLEGISAQILITATDLTWPDQFGFDRNSIFSVAQGQVEPRPASL
jgi:DNA replication and repair protein RecF